jgi:tetratricopeptide (TPR) repeat protein
LSDHTTDPDVDDALDDFGSALNLLLSISANKLVRDAQPQPYLDWIAECGPSLAPELLLDIARDPEDAVDAARLMRLMGHMVYAAMPLPQHHFQAKKLPLPGRNDPCLCGSLRKFKQCCEPMVPQLPKLPPEMGMPHVLYAIGKAAWKTLPAQKVSPALIEAAALSFKEAGHSRDAAALLEPWAAHGGRYPAAWADMLDVLGDLYVDLNHPRKRKALAQAMIDRGEPAVQSKGWQRLCLLATDADQREQAQQAFENAQRLAPDDVALSLLELSMLLGFGETDRAHERSQFHVRRLERMNGDGRWDDLIAALREMGEQGLGYLEDAELAHTPALKRLDDWIAGLPPPRLLVEHRHASPDDMGELVPAAPLHKPLAQWDKAFEVESPSLVALQGGGGNAWAAYPQWMALLEKQPVLADSFEVLDGLVLALSDFGGTAPAALARRLVARGLALWTLLREQRPAAQCHWGVWPNRPALRLIVQHLVTDDTPTAEHSFDWLRAMVEVLNPNDNHGFRSRLAIVYLRRGMVAEALALTDRYPDDADNMMLARVLALWHTGRRGDATSLLAEVLRGNAALAKVMRSAERPRPKHEAFITAGSANEAKITYDEQFDLWQEPALREVLMAMSRRTRP